MNRYSRRDLLIRAGVGFPVLLAACGGDDSGSSDTEPASATTGVSPTSASPAATTQAAPAPEGGSLKIITWPLYIEHDDPTTSPTLESFTSLTGIKVDYRAELNDNEEFYAKFQPDLAAGKGIGFDIVVPSSWMAARMITEGLVVPFEATNIPNKSNIRSDLASPGWDPQRQYSLPWAQGQTGISYFPDKTGRPLTSASDLLDPAFKNRVSILSEWRDSVGLFLLDAGVDPTQATMEQIRAAIGVIGTARDAGQFRKITGNSYVDDLITGEMWVAMAWSGDIASLKAADAPSIEFVLPEKGAMSFVDNCLIPVGAEHKAAAEAFLNFVYLPEVSGPLFESINYVSPVTGAAAFMTPQGQANPFVNPPEGAKLYEFRDVTADEEAEIVTLFAEATQL